jgi:ubiquinone/menaquinone biosynthesis C-methylase UbiE
MQKSIYNYAKKHKMTIEQIKDHYEIEKELASRLRNSTREERQQLYTSVYDELFKRVPYHPQLTQKLSTEDSARFVALSMQFLRRFLNPNSIFLEVGPGDCSLSLEVAKHVRKVYAVDVSNEITKGLNFPQNFELVISDGVSIPVAENSINIVYSDQLMEHLHPDDAIDQLQNIYKVLIPGGLYICSTPNQLSGPHDVSMCFDEVATGFHLKEYLVNELYNLFRQAGFSKVSLYKSYKQISVKIPLLPITVFMLKRCEEIISRLPFPLRRKIANLLILFRGMTVVGTK